MLQPNPHNAWSTSEADMTFASLVNRQPSWRVFSLEAMRRSDERHGTKETRILRLLREIRASDQGPYSAPVLLRSFAAVATADGAELRKVQFGRFAG